MRVTTALKRRVVPGRRMLITVGAAALLLTGCGQTVGGQAVSPLYDPFRVGGLPAVDGPSGIRDDGPAPAGTVLNSDGGAADRLAMLANNDVTEFWEQNYSPALQGNFTPIPRYVSYDSKDRSSPRVCGARTYRMVNAFFCPPLDLMAWDRAVMVPVGQKFFGDASISALMAHEYGHAVQRMADLIDDDSPSLVVEQQADCFAGAYERWVAEGNSPRFQLSTGDGLNHVLAGAITTRDPLVNERNARRLEVQAHGTALDRVSAFQLGFVSGAEGCAGIDEAEIAKRRDGLPITLQTDPNGQTQTGEVPIDESVLSALMEELGQIYSPAQPPTLSLSPSDCLSPQPGAPVAYCPDNNTIAVDLPALQQFGKRADEFSNLTLLQGDNTALSAVTSRYTLAVQHERGLPLDTATAALRTACLTGVAQKAMVEPHSLPSGNALTLTAGDIDEAVAGLLVNGVAASNVSGGTVPAGFTRIEAYRSGLQGDAELCYTRFP
jgi:predicted metalloprotease